MSKKPKIPRQREVDFLDEIMAEWTAKDPRFPQLVEEALARRRMGEKLSKARRHRPDGP